MLVCFVCTGNTCRSPMIAAMFEQYVNKRNARTRERAHMRNNIIENDNKKECAVKLCDNQVLSVVGSDGNMTELGADLYDANMHAIDNTSYISVDSAGIMQHTRPIAQYTCNLLRANGIEFDSEYISKFCDKRMFDKADYIFTMCAEQTDFLEKAYGASDKVISLARLNGGEEIPDPYGMGEQEYAQVYAIFDRLLAKLYDFVCGQ